MVATVSLFNFLKITCKPFRNQHEKSHKYNLKSFEDHNRVAVSLHI